MSAYNRLLEATVECISDGVIGFSKSGKVLMSNVNTETLLGYKRDKLIGKKYIDVIENEDFKKFLEEVFQNKEPGAAEKVIELVEGRVFSVFLVPLVKGKNLDALIAIIKEITDLRNIQKSMIDFVGNISHEFRTPLASIKGFVETLLEGALTDEVVCRRFLQVINEETNRLVRLTVGLSHVTSSQKGKDDKIGRCELVNISNIINNAIEMLYPFASQYSLEFEVDCPQDLPLVFVDVDRIKQVLINLIDNAIKYTGLKGSGKIRIEVINLHREIGVSVIDTGVGIPEEDLNNIFQRFYRVDRGYTQEVGGTGIGLAIAKDIVESFGGQIKVESEIGKGSKFTFSILKSLPPQ